MIWLIIAVFWAHPDGPEPTPADREPPALAETLTVTATGEPETLDSSASYVSKLDRERLAAPGPAALDQRLRQLPAFSLFRRSDSRYAHPTTQGFSLRGMAASGASRALALFDGLPLNDPFGGWVHWNRIPAQALESVEVVHGGGSQLYGGSALSGVLQLLPRRAIDTGLEARLETGERQAHDAELFHGGRRGAWAWQAAGRAFETDGFHLLDAADRGAVDRPADLRFQNLFARAHRGDFHLGLNAYREARGNGTALQENETDLTLLEAGLTRPNWRWRAYAQRGVFKNVFSRVAADRDQEFITANQRFESDALGSALTWRPAPGWRIGGDWRYAEWDGREQNLLGAFAQRSATLHDRLELLAGARLDFWRGAKTRGEISPRLGLAYRPHESWTGRASVYRGFRAPTLNELHRPFRVGSVITDANQGLDAETAWGAETGFDYYPRAHALFRFNAFYNRLDDAIGNATLSVADGVIRRQRQNLGGVDLWGVEIEAVYTLGRWSARAAGQYNRNRVDDSGRRLPQSPRVRASAEATWRGWLEASLQGRCESAQFDDDLNRFELAGYALFDLQLRKRLTGDWQVYGSVENLFDRRYAFSKTPLERLGAPRGVSVGARWRGGRP